MAEVTSPASNFADENPAGNNRPAPGNSGMGVFGTGIFPHGATTKYLWTRFKRAVLGLLILAVPALGADTYTPNLLLRKPALGVEDTATPWGTKFNNNMDIVEAATCDKRVGCTISGNVTVSGTLSATSLASSSATVYTATLTMSNTSFLLTGPNGFITSQSSVNASAFFGNGSNITGLRSTNITSGTLSGAFSFNTAVDLIGVLFQGKKTNAEIRALVCTNGVGACLASSSDEGDLYVSTGTLAGQYRNSRSGKGP